MSAAKRQRVAEGDDEAGGGPTATLRFRNYVPVDDAMKKLVLPPPKPPSEVIGDHIRKVWEEEEEVAKTQPLNIAPRRPNFDLKRDVARKMRRLDIKTQVAIADLIRQRLAADGEGGAGSGAGDEGAKSNAGGHQLATAVMTAKPETEEDDEDMD